MFALIKKEILSHIVSPIFSVTAALFLFLTGFAFTASLTQISTRQLPEASLRGIIYFMAVILLFISPFLAMKTFAEEKKLGTLELLLTSPLSNFQIVLGKYLGVLFLLAAILILTIEFPFFIFMAGQPDKAPMALSYLGIFLLGASFLSLGLLASVLTHSQMIAALLSFVSIITLWFLGEVGGSIGEKISPIQHLQSFSLGILDVSDVAYYLIIIFLSLFLTLRILERER